MKKTTFVIILIFVSFSASLFADQYPMVGPEALGVGGAYTAAADGPLAAIYNPSALAFQKGYDLEIIPPGLRTSFTGDILLYTNSLIDYADKYSKIKGAVNNPANNTITVDDVAAYITALKSIKEMSAPGNGMMLNGNFGVNIGVDLGESLGKCTLAVNNYTIIGVKPIPYGGYWLGNSTGTIGIVIDTSVANGDTVTTTQESQDLAKEIPWIRQDLIDAGVQIQQGLSDQELANYLVNSAESNGTSAQDISSDIKTIKDNKTLIGEFIDLTGQAAFMQQDSSLIFRGLNLTDISLSGAWNMFMDDLYVGASLKLLNGVAAYSRYVISSDSATQQQELKPEDIADKLKDNIQTSIQPAIDLGLTYDARETIMTRFSLAFRNINNPSFPMPGIVNSTGAVTENTITLPMQARFGAAFYPVNFLTVSADVDLTKNSTLIDDYYSQMGSLGIQIGILDADYIKIPLRFGIAKNIARDEGIIYTAGLGVKLFSFFSLDISGLMSTGTTETSSTSGTIPSDLSVQTGLNFVF